jgi:hypothetical protein
LSVLFLSKDAAIIIYLFTGSADKNRLTLQDSDEDGNEFLQEGWIKMAGRIVLQAVAKLARGLDLELDI